MRYFITLMSIALLSISLNAGIINKYRANRTIKKLCNKYENIKSFEATITRNTFIAVDNMLIGEKTSISKLYIEKPNKLAILYNPLDLGISYINDDSSESIIVKMSYDSTFVLTYEPIQSLDSVVINLPAMEIIILPFMFIENPYDWIMINVIYPAIDKVKIDGEKVTAISLVQDDELFIFYIDRKTYIIQRIDYYLTKDTEYGIIKIIYSEEYDNIRINEDRFIDKVNEYKGVLLRK